MWNNMAASVSKFFFGFGLMSITEVQLELCVWSLSLRCVMYLHIVRVRFVIAKCDVLTHCACEVCYCAVWCTYTLCVWSLLLRCVMYLHIVRVKFTIAMCDVLTHCACEVCYCNVWCTYTLYVWSLVLRCVMYLHIVRNILFVDR